MALMAISQTPKMKKLEAASWKIILIDGTPAKIGVYSGT